MQQGTSDTIGDDLLNSIWLPASDECEQQLRSPVKSLLSCELLCMRTFTSKGRNIGKNVIVSIVYLGMSIYLFFCFCFCNWHRSERMTDLLWPFASLRVWQGYMRYKCTKSWLIDLCVGNISKRSLVICDFLAVLCAFLPWVWFSERKSRRGDGLLQIKKKKKVSTCYFHSDYGGRNTR